MLVKKMVVERCSRRWVLWSPTMHGLLKLNMDGARKVGTKLGSASRIICDHGEIWICGFMIKIRVTTSFGVL